MDIETAREYCLAKKAVTECLRRVFTCDESDG